MASHRVLRLGGVTGVHRPDYKLAFYRDGDKRRPLSTKRFDHRSVIAIQTSKSIIDKAGTFSITVKDRRARRVLHEMDVVTIRLQGARPGFSTVLKGVLDGVRPVGSADPYGGRDDTVIHGRCVGKYLQINSLFLPVWDPAGNLPTALTFGLGDVTKKGSPTYKAGGLTPFNIFRYLVRNYVYGGKDVVGVSGTPNARFWLDYKTRFAKKLGFEVPFLQFDEDALADALARLEITGFTEAWIDEVGRLVYRRPQWDAPVRYLLSTADLTDWSYPRSDVDTTTYVEVIPAGDPGIDSAIAQALRAGRAPVPSSYVKAGGDRTQLGKFVSDEFIIDTTSAGKPTEKGKRNPWYRRQRRLGLRPQQISSPLLITQEQAQAQAEGLLRFYSRLTKGLEGTIPGAPELRLGYTIRVHGELEGDPFDRSGYIEQVTHDYVETNDGGQYTTSFVASHGRDAHDPFTGRPDPKWGSIALPKFDPNDLVDSPGGGVLDNGGGGGGGGGGSLPYAVGYPLALRGTLIGTPGVGTHSWTAPPNNWQSDNAIDIGVPEGTAVFAVEDGTISPNGLGFGSLASSGRFAGLRLHLQSSHNTYFYTHMRSYAPGIKPGAKVKKGDRLGASGSANGVPHLHFAMLHGNPQTAVWGKGPEPSPAPQIKRPDF